MALSMHNHIKQRVSTLFGLNIDKTRVNSHLITDYFFLLLDNGLSIALEAAKEAQKTTFNCSDCDYTTSRKDLLKKHTLRAHVLKVRFKTTIYLHITGHWSIIEIY